jgi:arginine N-succinyltransferase
MDDSSLVIRPIQSTDLNFLSVVAKKSGAGFTSFPDDLAYLKKKMYRSLDSFAGKLDYKSGLYLLILEDVTAKKTIGICGIEATAGAELPFYIYKIVTETQTSRSLHKLLEHKTLSLSNDLQYASELVSLFVDPVCRGYGYGELLSRARFLFIRQHLKWFSDTFVAEIRGITENNVSPFWEAIGKHFFAMDYAQAEFLKPKDNQFIAEFAPKHPIYLDLLPELAKSVIGKASPSSQVAQHVLEVEGFTYAGYIDVFNGGPIIQAQTNAIQTIKNSKVAVLEQYLDLTSGVDAMVCTIKNDFRLVRTKIKILAANKIAISKIAAERLLVAIGDTLMYG